MPGHAPGLRGFNGHGVVVRRRSALRRLDRSHGSAARRSVGDGRRRSSVTCPSFPTRRSCIPATVRARRIGRERRDESLPDRRRATSLGDERALATSVAASPSSCCSLHGSAPRSSSAPSSRRRRSPCCRLARSPARSSDVCCRSLFWSGARRRARRGSCSAHAVCSARRAFVAGARDHRRLRRRPVVVAPRIETRPRRRRVARSIRWRATTHGASPSAGCTARASRWLGVAGIAAVRHTSDRPRGTRPIADRRLTSSRDSRQWLTPSAPKRIPSARTQVPADALYGVQTLRARENFPISGLRAAPAVRRWRRCGSRRPRRSRTRRPDDSTRKLADAIVAGGGRGARRQARDQFIVDPYQAGAGTSHNMNVNEVLANRANELLGGERGDVLARASERSREHGAEHQRHDPDEHSARRVCRSSTRSTRAFEGLRDALAAKGREFDHIVKAGRTHLQDAMPIRLGQEFTAYAGSIDRGLRRVQRGGRLPARSRHRRQRGRHRRDGREGVSGADEQAPARDHRTRSARRQGSHPAHAEHGRRRPAFSAALRVLAIDLSKIASDLRLMVMGPRTGIDEIKLPAVQPGSSIMPGKINPSIPEMVNQVCFQVMGCDTTVAHRGGARTARAERDDAGHRVQRAALDAHPHERGARRSPSAA